MANSCKTDLNPGTLGTFLPVVSFMESVSLHG